MHSVSTKEIGHMTLVCVKMREFYEKWEVFVPGLLVGLNSLPLSPFQNNKSRTIFELKVNFRAFIHKAKTRDQNPHLNLERAPLPIYNLFGTCPLHLDLCHPLGHIDWALERARIGRRNPRIENIILQNC